MKTVCPKGTGVRIPLPAPNKRTTEPKKLGCFLFLWHWYERILTPLCDSLSRRMGFAYPTRRSKSSLFRRRVWVSSLKTNTPLPILSTNWNLLTHYLSTPLCTVNRLPPPNSAEPHLRNIFPRTPLPNESLQAR